MIQRIANLSLDLDYSTYYYQHCHKTWMIQYILASLALDLDYSAYFFSTLPSSISSMIHHIVAKLAFALNYS
jgi:hypothetical protein